MPFCLAEVEADLVAKRHQALLVLVVEEVWVEVIRKGFCRLASAAQPKQSP